MAERMTTILGVRVAPSQKKMLKEEAQKRGITLTDFIYDLINEGWQKIVKGDVKQEKSV